GGGKEHVLLMSVLGHQLCSSYPKVCSTADIGHRDWHVHFGPIADIAPAPLLNKEPAAAFSILRIGSDTDDQNEYQLEQEALWNWASTPSATLPPIRTPAVRSALHSVTPRSWPPQSSPTRPAFTCLASASTTAWISRSRRRQSLWLRLRAERNASV